MVSGYLYGFFLLAICVVEPARATYARPYKAKVFFAIDAGVMVTDLSARLHAPAGFASDVSDCGAYLRPRLGLPISKKVNLEPSFGILLPWRTSADGSAKTFTTQTDFDFVFPLFSFLNFRIGPGFQSLFIFGSGGDVILNNGTTTSVFHTAAGFGLTLNYSLQTGFELRLPGPFSFSPMLYVLDAFSSSRRAYNLSATFGVRFGA